MTADDPWAFKSSSPFSVRSRSLIASGLWALAPSPRFTHLTPASCPIPLLVSRVAALRPSPSGCLLSLSLLSLLPATPRAFPSPLSFFPLTLQPSPPSFLALPLSPQIRAPAATPTPPSALVVARPEAPRTWCAQAHCAAGERAGRAAAQARAAGARLRGWRSDSLWLAQSGLGAPRRRRR